MLMPDTVIPIHRHNESLETVIICRGKVREEFYDAHGVSAQGCKFQRECTIHACAWSRAA